MCSLYTLPDGIIIDFLTCGVLSSKDVLNFGLTCKRFNMLESTNSVWKGLFALKWPNLLHEKGRFLPDEFISNISSHSKENADVACQWKVIYYQVNTIFDQLLKVFHDYFSEDEHDDVIFDVFSKLCEQYSFQFVSAVLHNTIVSKSSLVSLTIKYYAKKAFGFIQRQWLKPKLLELLQMQNEAKKESELSALIQGTILIERWFNPMKEFPLCYINDFIKDAGDKTRKHFESISRDAADDPVKIAQLKYQALNHVFYDELKFTGNQGDYFNVNNSFIHQVIETRRGIPILLSIIYSEIAAKVGLHLHCINNPGHFVLGWQVEELDPTKQPTIADIAKAYRYIDVFNHGRILEYNELPRVASVLRVQSATLNEVLHRVALNVDAHSRISSDPTDSVQRSLNALNLCLLFEPNNHKVRAKRMTLNYTNNINLASVREDNEIIPTDQRNLYSIASTERVTKALKDREKAKEKGRRTYKPTISLRSSEVNSGVRYAVGMVMQHRRYDYICVIRGWDHECKMSRDWIQHMGVDELERGAEQPFYHVLVDGDGSQRYAAEDNLKMIIHKEELDHSEIGRYFRSTSDHPVRHYVPNSELALRYPEDSSHVMQEIEKLVNEEVMDEE